MNTASIFVNMALYVVSFLYYQPPSGGCLLLYDEIVYCLVLFSSLCLMNVTAKTQNLRKPCVCLAGSRVLLMLLSITAGKKKKKKSTE